MSSNDRAFLEREWQYWSTFSLRAAGFPVEAALHGRAAEGTRLAELLRGFASALDRVESARAALLAGVRVHPDKAWAAAVERAISRDPRTQRIAPVEPPAAADAPAPLAPALAAWAAAVHALNEAHESWDRELDARLEQDAAHLRAWIADPRVQEAIFLSSRAAAEKLAGGLADRRDLVLADRYLQRFSARAEGISFFGPVCLGRWGAAGGGVSVPADDSLARRRVRFTSEALLAASRALIDPADFAAAARLRRNPYVHFDGARLHLPSRAPVELPAPYPEVLALADGTRTREQVIAAAGDVEAADALDDLTEQGVLDHDLWPPLLDPDGERALLARLEALPASPARDRARSGLQGLTGLRDAFEQAPWPARVEAAARLREGFAEITGEAARGREQVFRGAREIYYEDTLARRQVELGEGFARELEALLQPVLDLYDAAARIAAAHREQALVAEWRRASPDGAPLSLAEFLLASKVGAVFDERGVVGEELAVERAAAAAVVEPVMAALGLDPSARAHEVAPARFRELVARHLPPVPPSSGYPLLDVSAPDVLVAAPSVEAIRRGEHRFVIGEIHRATNTSVLRYMRGLVPDERVEGAEAFAFADPPPLWLSLLPSSGVPRISFLGPDRAETTTLTTARMPLGLRRSSEQPISDFVIVAHEGGPWVAPRGGPPLAPLFQVLGPLLAGNRSRLSALDFFSGPHRPRLSVGRLVIAREAWQLDARALADCAAFRKPEGRSFRRLEELRGRLGLPRFVFAKSDREAKVFLVDFESPVSLHSLGKIAAQSERLSLTEMLPEPSQVWLPGHGGHLVCELRLLARRAPPPARSR